MGRVQWRGSSHVVVCKRHVDYRSPGEAKAIVHPVLGRGRRGEGSVRGLGRETDGWGAGVLAAVVEEVDAGQEDNDGAG